ncbi:MAG: hypothetical protein H0X37_02510 [Herpetosiphonaceae bacterium]|nr:hypothetical protein [Herpetosiphonaceae bacterium]
MRKFYGLVLLFALIVTGCGRPPTGSATNDMVGEVVQTKAATTVTQPSETTVPEATNSPALATVSTTSLPSSTDDPLRTDAAMMAKGLGISVDEAVHRLQMQNSIGTLGTALEQREAATFGGLWIQQQPVYRVVVAFTRNGNATIQPYVAHTALADLIDVRTVAVTYTELQEAQKQADQLLPRLGISFSSGINVQANRVEVNITDRVLFDAALQRANAKLPDHVVAITAYEPLRGPLPFPITPEPQIAFPQLRMRSAAFMAALLEGKLIEQDGCLRVRPSDSGPSDLVIWQPDYFVNRNGLRIEILDRTGTVVARVGDVVDVGGGETSMTQELEQQMRMPLPKQCDGPYWLMGELDVKK